ncbi:MAG: hypothetical protein WCE43_03115, partial [Burkholderiales bacterium]
MQAITVLASAHCAAFVHNLHADELEWVGIAADNSQALTFACQLPPNIYLQDYLSFSQDNGSLLLKLHSISPHTKVLPLYDGTNRVELLSALESGVKGCLPFNSPPGDCLKAIRAVHDGDIWLGRRDLAMAMERLIHKLHPFRYG